MGESQTLAKALDILFAIAETDADLSVSDIARKISAPESTVYRLLKTLEGYGVVERKKWGKIGIGLKIIDLARNIYPQLDQILVHSAKPVMEELTAKTGETSILMVRSGQSRVCVQCVESPHFMRCSIKKDTPFPLYRGASGKAILAFETDQLKEQIISNLPENDRKNHLAELAKIQKQGFCITVGDVEENALGIGVPIYDRHEKVLASLSIAGPADRMKNKGIDRLVQETIKASKQISDKMDAAMR